MKPLTRCPECRYSLKGLPADHRCPECSFEYDAETAMWKGRLDKKVFAAYLGQVCLVIWLLRIVLGGASAPSSVLGTAALFLGALAFLFVMYRAWDFSLTGQIVCTTPQGVWIKRGRRNDLYPYGEIDDVFWKPLSRNAGIKIRGRNRPFYIAQVFRRLSDFEDFESEVQRRKQAVEGKSLLTPPSEGSWTRRWRSRR